jgi:homogentisate phytyltransferase / homogentisate geranylgeranyltransferase
MWHKLSAFWQFSRPHTIVGTTLSLSAIWLIAAKSGNRFDFWVLLISWLACICGNIYIVGINQIFDIEIDKINKPHLPLAAAKFSSLEAQLIVGICGFLGVAIALTQGFFLSFTVIASLLIGTAYSVPPLRLKRFPFFASLCILVVRGAIVNLGVFLHFQQLLSQQLEIIPVIWLLTIFVVIFSYAIAIFKDMPDTEGDAQFEIATLSLSWGKQSVFNLTKWLLLGLYLGIAIAAIALNIPGINPNFMAVSHGIAAIALYWRSEQINLEEIDSVTDFYQFIWRLFFLEYLIFPVACWLA